MTSIYRIQPIEKTIIYNLVSISIYIQQLELNTKAVLTVYLYDETNVCRDTQILIMEGQDYQNWTSDEYVFDWVCQKLNLVPIFSRSQVP